MTPVAETESRVGNYILAVLFMLFGSVTVLGVVVTMNELSEAPERKEVERVTEIEVAKKPKPKPKQEVKRKKPKPKKTPKAPPRPFLQNMASNLSGIAFDLPGLQFEDLGNNAGDLLATNDEDVVHTGDTVDTPPQPSQQKPAEYPKRLRDRGIEGYVTFSLLINASGAIERVKVLESKPPGEFDQAAMESIRSWTFQPGLYKGEPVKVWVDQTIRFRLARR